MRRVVIESDLSSQAGATSVCFGLRGQLYEVDLTAEEFAGLSGVFARMRGPVAARWKADRRVPHRAAR